MSTEEFTASSILLKMLSRIPENMDKREGSIIYDALAPAAYELSAAYRLLFNAYEESFIATAQGAALDLRVQEMGLMRQSATKALKKGIFKDSSNELMEIVIGARFSSMDAKMQFTFVAIEKASKGIYKLECETPGAESNNYFGILSPVSHISGLGSAETTENLILGEDEESDAELRERYFNYVNSEIQDGNKAQYKVWASEFPGIGHTKVFPLWAGANTVKVSILDANNTVASNDLISEFQNYLDPNKKGLGNGVAPIGAVVTVSTAAEKTVNISASISVDEGYLFNDVKANIETALTEFFADIAYQSEAVFLMSVGAKILNTEGVSYATNLKLNNAQADISLGIEEIGTIGTLTFTEVTV